MIDPVLAAGEPDWAIASGVTTINITGPGFDLVTLAGTRLDPVASYDEIRVATTWAEAEPAMLMLLALGTRRRQAGP